MGAGANGDQPAARTRTRIFRWQGIIPLALGLVLLYVGWALFGERTIRDTITEAGTKALGTQLDIAELKIHSFTSTVELKGIALADPFDRTRNLFEIALVRLELEPKPLLEKKLVIKRLSIADVRITNSVGAAWVNPVYNPNGNMTTIPQPAAPNST